MRDLFSPTESRENWLREHCRPGNIPQPPPVLTTCFENSIPIIVALLLDFWALCFFAAWAFAVSLPERHTVTAVLSERSSQAESGSPGNENGATRFRSTDLSANLSRGAVNPVTLPLVEQRS